MYKRQLIPLLVISFDTFLLILIRIHVDIINEFEQKTLGKVIELSKQMKSCSTIGNRLVVLDVDHSYQVFNPGLSSLIFPEKIVALSSIGKYLQHKRQTLLQFCFGSFFGNQTVIAADKIIKRNVDLNSLLIQFNVLIHIFLQQLVECHFVSGLSREQHQHMVQHSQVVIYQLFVVLDVRSGRQALRRRPCHEDY